MFYWKKHSVKLIRVVVTLLAYGCPVQAIVIGQVVKSYKRRRVVRVARRLVQGTEEVLSQLLQASDIPAQSVDKPRPALSRACHGPAQGDKIAHKSGHHGFSASFTNASMR